MKMKGKQDHLRCYSDRDLGTYAHLHRWYFVNEWYS